MMLCARLSIVGDQILVLESPVVAYLMQQMIFAITTSGIVILASHKEVARPNVNKLFDANLYSPLATKERNHRIESNDHKGEEYYERNRKLFDVLNNLDDQQKRRVVFFLFQQNVIQNLRAMALNIVTRLGLLEGQTSKLEAKLRQQSQVIRKPRSCQEYGNTKERHEIRCHSIVSFIISR
jgi:hypothetical protein